MNLSNLIEKHNVSTNKKLATYLCSFVLYKIQLIVFK